MSLFRTDALRHRQSKAYGGVLITNPLSITMLTAAACAIAAAALMLLILGKYTQKQRVSGVLTPDKGVIGIYAPQAGIILSLAVKEGEEVRRGQVLYTLSSERIAPDGNGAQAEIRKRLLQQQQSFDEELARQSDINRAKVGSAQNHATGLQRELEETRKTERLLEDQVEMSNQNVARYEELAAKGFFSKAQVQERKMDLINARTRLQDIRRTAIELESELATTSQELKANALQGKNQSALIERSKQELQQNLQENEIKREVAIVAPADGIVTSILVQPGQSVGSTPLLSIIPKDSVLQAEIYAPSNAIGFIKKGGMVLLRYRAFPYQKFGQFHGKIISISRTPVVVGGAAGTQSVSLVASPAQMYRITVGLPAQVIDAYGREEKLQAGMELDADVLMDTRRLYEWLFEPLYSLKGKA